jgi:hypothetical protein
MVRKRDQKFSVYLWTQMPDRILRSKMLKVDDELGEEEQDSDEIEEDEEDGDTAMVNDLISSKPVMDSIRMC